MLRPLIIILAISISVLLTVRYLLPQRTKYLIGKNEFAFAALLPVIASFSFNYFIFAAAVVALFVWVPATHQQRLRLMMFSLPLLPFLDWLIVQPVQLIEINYPTILCLGVALAVRNAMPAAVSHRLRRWDLLFLLLLIVQVFMDARQTTPTNMLREICETAVTFGLFYYVLSRGFATVRGPDMLLAAMILAACIIAAIAIFEAAKVWLLYEYMPLRLGSAPEAISGYAKMRGGMLRARATFSESTSLSLFLGTVMCMLFALRRPIGSPRATLAIGLVLLGGQFATFARVGYLALVAGLLACLYFERRFARLAGLAVAVPALWIGLTAVAAIIPAVASSIGVESDAATSIDYRSRLLEAGLQIIRDHPLTGLSVVDLFAHLEHLRQGEGIIDLVNQPLTILMRAGVIGGLLYYAMSIALLISLARRPRWGDPSVGAAASACFAGFVALMVGLTTSSYGRNESTFVLLLGAGAGIMARRTEAASWQPVDGRAGRLAGG